MYSTCKSDHFYVMYFNARSLLPKLDFLRALCVIHSPDCICIVESWLNSDILNNELYIDGYTVVRLDRNRHGGGVLFFIKSVYSYNIIYNGSPDLELLIVSICTGLAPLTLALFYRPPSSSTVVLDNLLTVLFTHINPLSLSNFILLGDFNVNYFNHSHPLFTKLLFVSSSLSLTQVVTVPTHYTSNSSSLIDLVFYLHQITCIFVKLFLLFPILIIWGFSLQSLF